MTWRQADALDLPFEDGGFDVVACQFGAMFLPDRVRGFREAARVLAPGGTFVLTTWDRLESSEVLQSVQRKHGRWNVRPLAFTCSAK